MTTPGDADGSRSRCRFPHFRILKVTQSYYPFLERGGPAVKVRALAPGLARKGQPVTVLTSDLGITRTKDVPIERRIAQWRVYLVGDAAAQVKVTTLGGVVTGFRGALAVSERVLNGGFSPELRALRRELDLHMLIRRSIHGFRQADYSCLVDWMNHGMKRQTCQRRRAAPPLDGSARIAGPLA